jgi:hypothetical protein
MMVSSQRFDGVLLKEFQTKVNEKERGDFAIKKRKKHYCLKQNNKCFVLSLWRVMAYRY